jgi:hypothetical protein
MHAVHLHVATPAGRGRTVPWISTLVALGRETALAVLVLASVAVAMVLLLLLAFVAAPLASVLIGWLVWRSARASRPPIRRLRARWGRGARIVAGGGAAIDGEWDRDAALRQPPVGG